MMSFSSSKDYLVKENYYQQNSELGYYHGNGLEHLGMKDGSIVTKEDYNQLQLGYNPISGETLVKNAGDHERRAGMDATFSAPKSMSVLDALARAHGDEVTSNNLRAAQDRAVQNAMEKMQNNFIRTRVVDPDGSGERIRVKTDGLIWASFLHDTGRETSKGFVDPQIHTHNFIFNVVTYTDPLTGEIRTLSLSNEEIMNNKMYLGQYYRNELANELKSLGYSLALTDARQGFFELAKADGELLFDRTQLKAFSGRSEEIQAAMAEFEKKYPNINEAKLKDIINQAIKTGKKTLDEEIFLEEFIDRAYRTGITEEMLKELKEHSNQPRKEVDAEILQDHIEKSLAYITEKESVFNKEDFMKECLKYGLEYGLTEKDYEIAINENSNFIQLGENQFTSQEMIDIERETIVTILSTKTHFQPIADSLESVKKFTDEHFSTMNEGQLNFVQTVLFSRDQFIAVQGKAGTGKTFSAKAIKDYLDRYHPEIEIVGASFMGKAADGLEQDSGIKSSTLDSYFLKEKSELDEPRSKQRILLIDEAAMSCINYLRLQSKRATKLFLLGIRHSSHQSQPGEYLKICKILGFELSN